MKPSLGTRVKRAIEALFNIAGASGGYKGAESNRLLADFGASRAPVDDILKWSNKQLRARARGLERNSAIVRQYLRLLVVNVVGPDGMKLQSQVRDNSGKLNKRINDTIEAAWQDWGTRVTLDGKMALPELQRLLLRSVARDGEAFVRLWRAYDGNRYGLALEAIDPDLVDESFNRARGEGMNEIRLGVEVDDSGRPVAFHVWDKPRGVQGRKPERIPADQVIHLYDPERVNQSRGATWLAPVMVPIQMLEGYREAELVAARMAASKMGFFVRKENQGSGLPAGKPGVNLQMEVEPGQLGMLPDGYEFQSFDPNHPSTAFPEFVKDQARTIATGLGVSYNALMSDLTDVNYSSMRSGLLIERDSWRVLQRWWQRMFLTPVFNEWVGLSLLTGALKFDTRDPVRFRASHWTARGWSWVDPAKDTTAGVQGIQNGLASRTSLLAEQGIDFEQIVEELAEEQRIADEQGIKLSSGAPAAAAPAEPDDDDTAQGGDASASKSKGRNGHAGRLVRELLDGSLTGGN